MEKMSLFTKVKMNNFSGRAAGKHHFVPTSWKKGKTIDDLNVLVLFTKFVPILP